MESITTWFQIFTRSCEVGNNEVIARVLKDATEYLQTISENEKETILEILFDKKKGILKFINNILGKQKSQMIMFNNSLQESFKLIQFIMEFLKSYFKPYIMPTRDICLNCIKIHSTYNIRKVASDTLKKLIQVFQNYEMKLHEIIQEYKEESVLFNVIGAIARYYPQTKDMDKLASPIFMKLLYDLQQQSKLSERKQQKDTVRSYLECFLDMMVNFKPTTENTESLYFEHMYEVFLLLCKVHKSPDIINNILCILSAHIQYFSSFMFKDHEKWHEFLNILYKNSSTYKVIDTLRAFYKIIPSHTLKDQREDIFIYFKNYFMLNITNVKLSSDELGSNIFGLGQLSVAYNKFLPTEINELFQIISHQALLFSEKKEQEDKNIQLLPDYLQALSEILNYLPSISLYKLNIIIKLSILNVKKFAELKARNQTNAIDALKVTFVNIKRLENNLQRQYFHALFYEGTLWSCSHALFVDIELQQEIKNLSEYPLCYKNYLPLWHSLFKIENYQLEFIQQIFYELVSVLILFIDQLNLNVKPKQNKSLSDTSLSLKAENEADFRYFINLVDLYTQIFEEINIELLQNHVERILKCFIKSSYKYPMVSGFYKLIKVVFRKPNIFCDFEIRVSEFTRELIPQYLSDVIQLIYKFSDELQLACIELIFSTPVFLITNKIEVVSVFKIAFKIGLTDPSLAFCALETLKNWTNSLQNENLTDFYKNIFKHVEPYLSSDDFLLDISKYASENSEEKIKNAIVLNEGSLQRKILQICCAIKYDSVLEDKIFSEAEVSWNVKHLPFELLFPDLQNVEICLDKFIERIKDLISSGNRKTKFSACELLHTIITIILGKKLIDQCFNKSLCSTVLKLGCESDSVIKNLYHPLVIQLTHYLSLKPIRESQMSQIFIDSLFDGLADDFNPSLRDYCGVCLKEFVEWTIKQSPEYDRSNFRKLVQRIINFSLSPTSSKRLGAAIAFNHLCTTLGGSISIINRHWLEFLYVFVKALEKCDDIRIISAINNVESVIKVTSNTLNAKSLHREKPLGFASETLKSATMWLFDQCGSLNIRCRHKSMELFENLYLFIPGNKSIEEFFNSRSASSINRVVLKNLDKDFEHFTATHIQIFLKCLDFYIWIFNKGFLTPESVFDAEDAQDEAKIFFQFFSKFVSLVINENIADISRLRTNTAKEAEELVYLFNKKKDSTNILKNLCTDNLYILISRFTLCPQRIGLIARILQTITSQQLENWFIEIMKHLPETYISKLISNFVIEKAEDYIFFNDTDDIINFKRDTLPSKHFMRNIIILKKCKLFNFEDQHHITVAFAKEKIRIIFEALRAAVDNGDVLKRIDTNMRIYLEGVVQFFLLDYQPELLETIIDLMVSGSSPTATSSYVISHQEYFLDTFKVPVFSCVMKSPVETLRIFEKKLAESPDEIFLLIEELLIFSQHNRSENSEALASEMIRRCATYRSHVGNVVRRGDRFFNINRVAVSLMSNSASAIYTEGVPNALYGWIVDELGADTDCDRKFAIMESFLVCMIDEAGPGSAKLPEILRGLRDPDSDAWLAKLRSNEVERSRAVQCFHVLARLLEVTRSNVIYEGLARYAAGGCELLTAESASNSLRLYLAMISAEKLLKSLETIYELFKARSSSARERLDLVRYFLLASLESCRIPVLGKFYEQNAREMTELVAQTLPDEALIAERSAALVTKIGCYRLLELMFCKLPPSMIIIYVVEDKHTDLGLFLAELAIEVRKLVPRHEEERELTRLLHCAAFNFFVAVACARHDEGIYKAIFREADNVDQFIWRRIVDCERTYELTETSPSFRWQPISIRRANDEVVVVAQVASYAAYFRRDSQRMPDLQMMGEGSNGRQWIGLEYDELNVHECAATITGAIIHLVNSKVSPLPAVDAEEPKEDQLPDWLVHFRKALDTDIPNVKLFLMRIIGNARLAFVPYLRSLFVSLVRALRHYLAQHPLNYLVRDMLLIIVESKYELRTSEETREAQKLLEIMIERLYDRRAQVYDYNLELLERLVIIWRDSLECPETVDGLIASTDVGLTTNVILILLRHGVEPKSLIAKREMHAMIRRSMFMWQEPITPRTFETLGWIMRYIDNEQRDNLIQNDLMELFTDVKRYDVDYCARLVYLLCLGCPQLAGRAELRSFIEPRGVQNDKFRADCMELFLKAMDKLEVEALVPGLECVNLKGVLRDWDFPCLNVAFRIVDKLLGLLDATQLLPYAQLLEAYVKPKVLLEYKRNAYGFFARAYERHASTRNQESESLTKLCVNALIGGTADPNDVIQDTVLEFWCTKAGVPQGSVERLQNLLGLYSPRVHASYAQFLVLVMLELAVKAPESERLLYGRLVQCHYEDYEIVASRTRRRSRTRAPLFAPSLLAQLERAVAQQGSRLRRPVEKERAHEAATHLVPETTLEQLERLMGSSKTLAATSSRGPILDPSENKLSRRIPESSSNKSPHTPLRTATQEYFRRLRKEARTQRESVKINRKYRLGNYPDVEISQSSVVASLQGLARADRHFAADLLVSLVCALTKLRPELQPAVEDTCRRALKQPNDFAIPALEILLRSECASFDAQDVTKTAESMGLHASAILLLEKESIRRNESSYTVLQHKKLRGVLALEHRLELAKLYKCLGHHDVVGNIIRDWTLPAISDDLRRGYVAEMEGDWSTAAAAYEIGYDAEVEDAQGHCLEGMFRCFNELSSWTRINGKINLILNKDYNSIWQNPNKDSLLPWIFTGQLQKLLDDLETGRASGLPLMEHLDDWISEKGVELTKKFGDQISMLYLCNNEPPSEATSRYCLERCLDGAKERWSGSGASALGLKQRVFDTLSVVKDIDAFLRTVSSDNLTSALGNLIRYWEDDSSEVECDFHTWNLRMRYRVAFSFALSKMLQDTHTEPDVRADLLISRFNQRLKITKLAINHRKRILAQKHLLSIKESLDQMDVTSGNLQKFQHELSLVSSGYNLLCGEMENKIEEKLVRYVISWKLGHSLVTNDAVDLSTRIQAKHHVFKVALAISNFMQKDTEYLQLVTSNQFINTTLGISSSVEIEDALLNYRYNALKSVCYEGTVDDMRKSREIFAKYCYFMISDKYDRNLNDLKDFVEAVLAAMTIGCTNIIYYFPCLLKYLLYRKSERNMQLFIDNCRNVPTWMFLYWQEQIVSQLASSLKPLVLPIVERLAKDYPNAIIYSFRAICEAHSQLREDPAIDAVHKTLFADQRIEIFFNSMKYLYQPEHYLKYHLLKIIRASADYSDVIGALDTFLKEIFAEGHQIYIKSLVHKRVFVKHRNDLQNLKNATNIKDLKKCVTNFCAHLDDALLTRLNNEKESLRLDSYSPYLAHFSDEIIMLEVPGQYGSKEKPLVHHHARIARIDDLVQLADGSLGISLLGTDARTYRFLVTFGSNARQQERVQRILETMNDSLRGDPCCRSKLLRVGTHCVVPLSRSMSLARMTEGTRSLRECIEFSMSDKTILESASINYRNWIEQLADDETTSRGLVYKQALLKYSARDVIAKMKELDGFIPWDLLRKTFVHLSSSANCFIQLRHKFITSYATMCVVHWILGVGNRFLENTHVEMKTGRCLGREFSLMFGGGLDQPIPELVPFRLTTQILGLLRPFREQDLFGLIMTDVLHALRNDRNLILDCLEIFMYEPFDWNERVNQLWRDDDDKHEDVKWISKIKMSILKKKLNGAKPSNIMLEELSYLYENNDDNLECFAIFGYIINGNELHHATARVAFKNNDLTAKEQVHCLLDQATDANVLGRMWAGWHPFV